MDEEGYIWHECLAEAKPTVLENVTAIRKVRYTSYQETVVVVEERMQAGKFMPQIKYRCTQTQGNHQLADESQLVAPDID